MIERSSINYVKKDHRTYLSAKFRYKRVVELGVSSKEDIQKRLNLANNGKEMRKYLSKVEGLALNCLYIASERDGLRRHLELKPNKRRLRLKINVYTDQQVSMEKMFNLDDLDTFIAEGKYPEEQGEDRKI